MKKIIPVFIIVLIASTYGFVSSTKKLNEILTKENAEKRQLDKFPKWLPKDFNSKKDILLIEETSGGQQKKIEAFMEEDYPYKYEFVKTGIVDDDKYPSIVNAKNYVDTKLYRFILVHTMALNISRQGEVGVSHAQGGIFDYNFIDRLNNKTYPKTGSTSSWAFRTFKSTITKILEINENKK